MGYFSIFDFVVGQKKFMVHTKYPEIFSDATLIYGGSGYVWTSQPIIMFDIETIYTYIHSTQKDV